MNTMTRKTIDPSRLNMRVIHAFSDAWMLLTAGDKKSFNTMTISWGAIGEIWSKPVAIIVVRPSRHTYKFIEQSNEFTLCALPAKYKKQMTLLGSKSGREIDKVKASGLNPIPSQVVKTPSFDEAELIIECRKLYFDDIVPAHFLHPDLESNYGGKDYHRLYVGEIVHVEAGPGYQA
jgi:flavin reductase (DIM6/NTAB) family NADH-FMN oxidoreductase RutF